MTQEERRSSIQAMTQGDREAFRRLFWMRRDPNPSTPQNETLDLYLARVRLADSNFSDDGGYGGGDRARVFVLLGMPVQALAQPATETTPEGLLWVFPPDPEHGLADTLEAPVLPRRGRPALAGKPHRRGQEPRRDAPASDYPATDRLRTRRGEPAHHSEPPRRGSERARRVLSGLEAGARGKEHLFLPGDPRLFQDRRSGDVCGPALRNARRCARAGTDGQLAASVFAKTASAEEEGPGAATYRLETAHTSIQAADGPARFETSLVLPPGAHRLLVGVVDEQSDAYGAAQVEIEAPVFPETEPGFSSVVLYSDTTTQQYSGRAPGRAFQFGRTHFEPRSTGVFPPAGGRSAPSISSIRANVLTTASCPRSWPSTP